MSRALMAVRATAVVLSEAKVLLVESEMSPDWWVPPGGHLHFRETAAQAARREALEEAGLSVEIGHLVGYRHVWWPQHDTMELYFAARPAGSAGAPQDWEQRPCQWIALDALDDVPHYPQGLARLCRQGQSSRPVAVALDPLDLRHDAP